MSDPLGRALAAWNGTVAAPHERVEIPKLRGVEATPDDPGERRRPIVCTAFGGTSAAAAASLLHLWQLGYAPAPLDMRLLVDDLATRLVLVRPRQVLATPEQAPKLRAAVAAVPLERIDVLEVDADPSGWDIPLRARESSPDDLGMIIFTSGTTGTPKAVALTRANLHACAEQVALAQRLDSNDVVLNPLSLAHVNAPVIALLASVVSQGSVVLMRHFDPRQFWSLAARTSATWANLVPPLIATLARHAADPPANRLRFIRSASAPLGTALMQRFESTFGVAIVESYGISEASSQVTINDVPPGRRVPGSVGRARGVQVRISEDGEVLVAGPTVMREYLGDEAATQEALRDGWLYTGDLGEFDVDGNLRLVGRRKELINRGGEKIAPRVVEEALLQHPDVADCAVAGVPHDVYGEEVKAFVVAREGSTPAASELLHFAAARLPLHSRPRLLELVTEIPRNPSGKVMRRQLVAR